MKPPWQIEWPIAATSRDWGRKRAANGAQWTEAVQSGWIHLIFHTDMICLLPLRVPYFTIFHWTQWKGSGNKSLNRHQIYCPEQLLFIAFLFCSLNAAVEVIHWDWKESFSILKESSSIPLFQMYYWCKYENLIATYSNLLSMIHKNYVISPSISQESKELCRKQWTWPNRISEKNYLQRRLFIFFGITFWTA